MRSHGGIRPKLKLVQAFIVVLVTCKNEKDPIKNEDSRVLTKFPPLSAYGIFFQTPKACYLHSPWSNHAEFRTRPIYYGCPSYLQE